MPSLNYMAGLGSAGQQPGGGSPILPGAPSYNYDPRFGGIPGVPSPGGTQQQAINSNISALGPLYNLGAPLNQFTAQQAPASLNLNLPNYQASNQQLGSNILSKLQGQIPQDVANQLQQFGAERGVATGSIGSPNANAATLRALGLTSLDMQNQGAQQFSQAIAQTPQGQQFNPFGFLVSPEQQQQAQYQANLLNSAPVPSSAQFAGLNALQSGRNAGSSGFPSSARPSSPIIPGPYSPSQQPLGGPSPQSGGTAYSSSTPPWQSGMPSSASWTQTPFDTSTGVPQGWQTGMPLEGYGGPTWGGGAYPPVDPGIGPGVPYNQPANPTSGNWGSDPFLGTGMGLNTTMSMFNLNNTMLPPNYGSSMAPYAGQGYFQDPLTGGQYLQLPGSGEWDTLRGGGGSDTSDFFSDGGG